MIYGPTLAQAALISRRCHVLPSSIPHKSHRLASALWYHNLIFSQISEGSLITPTILSGQTTAASGDMPPTLANGVLSRLSVRRVVLLESDCLHCLVRPPHEDPPNPTRSQEKVHVEDIAGFTVRSLSFFLSVRRPNVTLLSLRLATAWSSHEQDVRIHLTVESRLPAPNLSASTSSSREILRTRRRRFRNGC